MPSLRPVVYEKEWGQGIRFADAVRIGCRSLYVVRKVCSVRVRKKRG